VEQAVVIALRLAVAATVFLAVSIAFQGPEPVAARRPGVASAREKFYFSRACPGGGTGWYLEQIDQEHAQATFACEYEEEGQ
jgi:hypothetical protein